MRPLFVEDRVASRSTWDDAPSFSRQLRHACLYLLFGCLGAYLFIDALIAVMGGEQEVALRPEARVMFTVFGGGAVFVAGLLRMRVSAYICAVVLLTIAIITVGISLN